jgi:hypothetical protein
MHSEMEQIFFCSLTTCNPILSNLNLSIPKLSMTILSNHLFYRIPKRPKTYIIETSKHRLHQKIEQTKELIHQKIQYHSQLG